MVVDLETKLIGKRLKLIRNIINEGGKLSVEQFAYIMQETGDKMRNYELGRATLPNRVLQALHLRGFNISFIITGEGDVFNNSPAGIRFRKLIQAREINLTDIWTNIYNEIDNSDIENDEIVKKEKAALAEAKAKEREEKIKEKEKLKLERQQIKIQKVAAGNIAKAAQKEKERLEQIALLNELKAEKKRIADEKSQLAAKMKEIEKAKAVLEKERLKITKAKANKKQNQTKKTLKTQKSPKTPKIPKAEKSNE